MTRHSDGSVDAIYEDRRRRRLEFQKHRGTPYNQHRAMQILGRRKANTTLRPVPAGIALIHKGPFSTIPSQNKLAMTRYQEFMALSSLFIRCGGRGFVGGIKQSATHSHVKSRNIRGNERTDHNATSKGPYWTGDKIKVGERPGMKRG